MDDEPKTVKELLVELKDASELMVDLAYAAVFFNEEKLAREVDRLEERMNGQLRRLRIMAMPLPVVVGPLALHPSPGRAISRSGTPGGSGRIARRRSAGAARGGRRRAA